MKSAAAELNTIGGDVPDVYQHILDRYEVAHTLANREGTYRSNMQQAKVLADLLRELSTELDLHYDGGGLIECQETIGVMKSAAAELAAIGGDVPDVFRHILSRYEAACALVKPNETQSREEARG
jgi:hypothetical protein